MNAPWRTCKRAGFYLLAVALCLCFLRENRALPAPAHAGFQRVLFVDLTRLRIYCSANGKYYPIAAGNKEKDGNSHTPKGRFTIIEKGKDPLYYDVNGKLVAGPYRTDKNNVYGTRFIRLDKVISGRNLGIHGTNEPELIGTYSSHACVRMNNADVEELFDLIDVGDRVEIF
jgi:lipoprotein-anchoring transpeptidase ErfK/SrfK